MNTKIVKSCSEPCNQKFTVRQWVNQPLAYWTNDGTDVVEWRDCVCGSTLGVDARDVYDVAALDQKLTPEEKAVAAGLLDLHRFLGKRGYQARRKAWEATLVVGTHVARVVAFGLPS